MRAMVLVALLPWVAFAQREDSKVGGMQTWPMQSREKNTPGIGEHANVSTQDREFLEKAASAGMYEVRAAQLALQKSNDDQVKSIARHLIDDHQQANDKLKSIAASEGLVLAAQLMPEDQRLYEQLLTKSGKDFDKTYLEQQKAGHNQAINLFESEAQMGSDPALKSFAEQTLPTLRMHKQMISR